MWGNGQWSIPAYTPWVDMAESEHQITTQSPANLALPGTLAFDAARRPSFRLALALQGISLVLDVIALFVTFWLSYELRYNYRIGAMVPVSADTLGLSQWTQHAFVAIVFTLVVFGARGVYQVQRKMTWGDYIPLVVTGFGTAIAGVILFAFFIQFSPSRAIYIYVLVIGTALMLGHRAITLTVRTRLFERGLGVDHAIIVGQSENARRLAQSLLGQSQWGYALKGFISNQENLPRINVATEAGIRWTERLGGTDDIARVAQQYHVDDVFIIEADHTNDEIDGMIESCRTSGVRFRLVPELLQISMDRVDITEINGVPLIGIRDASIRGWSALTKRSMDVLVSAILLVLLAIPAAIIAMLIKRDSEGPVFYTQTRVGQYGREFQMIKFRTMVTDADNQWSQVMRETGGDSRLFKDRQDRRITKTGAWLRKFSLDEMPQIWNVFRGDMAFVGPRPPLPREVAEYQAWHQQRLLVRPGMTGLWQVSGRSDLSFDQMVRLDLYYAENWSLWLDLKILLRTIPAVILGRGAY